VDGPTRTTDPEPITIELRGRCTLAEVPVLWRTLQDGTARLGAGDRVRVDLSGVETVDGSAVVVLEHARRDLEARGVSFALESPPTSFLELLRLYSGTGDPRRARSVEPAGGKDFLSAVGRQSVAFAAELSGAVTFLGRAIRAVFDAVREPASVGWQDLAGLMEKAGADAVPIVSIIDFLIGLVTGYEAIIQLKRFGATLYAADLVGASVVRELGPLITAVVVTGRTGAAFAAELGTMAVSDEIDALRAMGFDPMRFLVLPRTIALALVMPVLTLLGDAVGVLGGLLVARALIGMTGPEYLAEMKQTVFASDVFWGVMKGFAFAIAIGLLSCQQGLAATGGAAGVGRRTTSAVVASLFAIILLDAAFAPFFKGHFQ
jgi:phospholipid/cholesterol/gamma-HCH transport system permease protein